MKIKKNCKEQNEYKKYFGHVKLIDGGPNNYYIH